MVRIWLLYSLVLPERCQHHVERHHFKLYCYIRPVRIQNYSCEKLINHTANSRWAWDITASPTSIQIIYLIHAAPGSIWYYAPNKAAPIVLIVLFFISGVIHAWQTIKHRSWRTTILLPWAAALMIVGFIIRELGAHHTENLTYLIASTVLIMSGPRV